MKIELDKVKKLDIEDGDVLVTEAMLPATAKKLCEYLREQRKPKIGITIVMVEDIDKIGVVKKADKLKFKDKK